MNDYKETFTSIFWVSVRNTFRFTIYSTQPALTCSKPTMEHQNNAWILSDVNKWRLWTDVRIRSTAFITSWVLWASFPNKLRYSFFVDTKRFIYCSQRQIQNVVTSQMEDFLKIVNGLILQKLFTTSSILDIWRGLELVPNSAFVS